MRYWLRSLQKTTAWGRRSLISCSIHLAFNFVTRPTERGCCTKNMKTKATTLSKTHRVNNRAYIQMCWTQKGRFWLYGFLKDHGIRHTGYGAAYVPRHIGGILRHATGLSRNSAVCQNYLKRGMDIPLVIIKSMAFIHRAFWNAKMLWNYTNIL
jgi:hypothetical protein